MKRSYRWDRRTGEMVEVTPPDRSIKHQIMTDAYSNEPTKSPVDGKMITSRAELREHNKRNGVVDVGNDPWFANPEQTRYRDLEKQSRRDTEQALKEALQIHGVS